MDSLLVDNPRSSELSTAGYVAVWNRKEQVWYLWRHKGTRMKGELVTQLTRDEAQRLEFFVKAFKGQF